MHDNDEGSELEYLVLTDSIYVDDSDNINQFVIGRCAAIPVANVGKEIIKNSIDVFDTENKFDLIRLRYEVVEGNSAAQIFTTLWKFVDVHGCIVYDFSPQVDAKGMIYASEIQQTAETFDAIVDTWYSVFPHPQAQSRHKITGSTFTIHQVILKTNSDLSKQDRISEGHKHLSMLMENERKFQKDFACSDCLWKDGTKDDYLSITVSLL